MKRSRVAKIGLSVAALAYAVILLLVLIHPHSSQSTSFPNVSPAPTKSRQNTSSPPAGSSAGSSADSRWVGVAVNSPIMPSIYSFSSVTGVHPAVVELYTSFGAPFNQNEAGKVIAAGSVPLIQWNPRHAPLAQIAQGAYDGYLRRYAAAVKAFRHHIVLSFAHEMNGRWYPWSRPHSTPAQFIAAYRHIHSIFARRHVTNVTWSWDPSHIGSPASQWWPGSAYVNWIGIDGYQRPGQTFAQIFAKQLANIRSFTNKPVFIGETSVAPNPGQARQIAGLFRGLIQYHLAGFVWFNINRLKAWRLEGRPVAVRAFRRNIARMKRAGALSTHL